jgi:hypothetical protein
VGGSVRSRITATVIGAAILIGGYAAVQGGGEAVSANLFTSTSAGSSSCVRSSTLKTYTEALAVNAVCASSGSFSSWEIACAAATAGDKVGVMPGVYARVGVWMFGNNTNDCSDGAGADYNPNWAEQGVAQGSLANWVTFVAGEDCGGTPNISFSTHINIKNNRHLIVEGECFNLNRTLYLKNEGSRSENIIFRGSSRTELMEMYGIEIIGAKNILLENIDYGPSVQCAANDTNATPAYFRCDPAGPYFEAPFATFGTNSPGCTPDATGLCAGWFGGETGANEFVEPYIHGYGAESYTNIRFQNFQLHDGQAKGTGAGVHPGCFMFDGNAGISGLPSHNMVFDSVSCERQVVGVQHQDAGVTVQNSYFGCSTRDLAQTSPQGKWDDCAVSFTYGVGCRNDLSPGCSVSNVLFRNNVFYAGGSSGLLFNTPSATYGTFSNVRVIGNIFLEELVGCGNTGITCANNSFFGATPAGSSTTTLSCDPTIDSDQGTSDDLWRERTQLNPRLNGSSCGVPTLDPSALGADYQLGFDIDGDARGSTATRAGVEN